MTGRRKDKRFQLRSCRVSINKSSFLGLGAKPLGKVVLINLSVTGVQVLTTIQLDAGKKYKIKITTNVFPPMDIAGKVIWSKLHKGKNFEKYYRTGFSFIKPGDDYRKNLKKLEADPLLREVTRSIV
ncbi:MAG: PilZ domain-containing protein [Deltaproteobacteria bacterium]|nr:PilZ domain-containing protein [Deltaproteobacteria bacterium]